MGISQSFKTNLLDNNQLYAPHTKKTEILTDNPYLFLYKNKIKIQ